MGDNLQANHRGHVTPSLEHISILYPTVYTYLYMQGQHILREISYKINYIWLKTFNNTKVYKPRSHSLNGVQEIKMSTHRDEKYLRM